MASTYNPQAKLKHFIDTYGELGKLVLGVWNQVNPLCVYYGEDCNPDEYLGYAERFIVNFQKDSLFLNDSLRIKVMPNFILEVIRRCFGSCQIAQGFATEEMLLALRDRLMLDDALLEKSLLTSE